MSVTPTTGSAVGRQMAQQVWFLDTSALVTLAVHPPLQRAVEALLLAQRRVLVKAVVVELEGLASTKPPVAHWAATALGQLGWIGEPVGLDDLTTRLEPTWRLRSKRLSRLGGRSNTTPSITEKPPSSRWPAAPEN